MNAAHVITAQGLSKRFGREAAVADLGFTVPPGTLLGLIGPSGCGKTTTVRLLTGVYRPSAGTATVLGQDPRHFTAATRRRIGYMPQTFVMYQDLSVWENLNFAASLYGQGLRRKERLREVLRFVELEGHRRKLARRISGGMQRRLALAATLTHDPELIFLDEPTAGIDPILRRKFWDYFKALKEAGRTLFITTQYVGEVVQCDWVGVMADGRLLMVDTPDGLRRQFQGGDLIEIRTKSPHDEPTRSALRHLDFVIGQILPIHANALRVTVKDAGQAVPALIDWARSRGFDILAVEKYEAPMDDVFVQLINQQKRNG